MNFLRIIYLFTANYIFLIIYRECVWRIFFSCLLRLFLLVRSAEIVRSSHSWNIRKYSFLACLVGTREVRDRYERRARKKNDGSLVMRFSRPLLFLQSVPFLGAFFKGFENSPVLLYVRFYFIIFVVRGVRVSFISSLDILNLFVSSYR